MIWFYHKLLHPSTIAGAVWSGSTMLPTSFCPNTHLGLFIIPILLWVDSTYGLPHDKTNKMTVCPAKTQISLGIRFLHADSEDSDQTGRMPRLICRHWAHMPFCWFCHEAAQLCFRALVWLLSDKLNKVSSAKRNKRWLFTTATWPLTLWFQNNTKKKEVSLGTH